MSNRHLARTVALQSLYEWDFYDEKKDAGKIVERNIKEMAPDLDEKDFAENIVKFVLENQKEIDSIISKFAPDWPLEKITTVDRNVLRIGTYELVFNQDIPSKVSINEAIEVAKTFGGESSGKFVNGVLGAIYRDQLDKGVMKKADLPKEKKEEKEKGTKESKS
ncbi:MAG: transcription antitermination factor NusB [Patescibacteria group bacterium]|nr:transcription antitermination factor NusB [Patescibacteria group bacterium]MBU2509542.1 transcription antitermination factor NusB [Patescibacteria group bacterium]